MQGFDKELVRNKLNELGLHDISKKLSSMSENEIEKMIRSNPDIIRKANEIMKGRK